MREGKDAPNRFSAVLLTCQEKVQPEKEALLFHAPTATTSVRFTICSCTNICKS